MLDRLVNDRGNNGLVAKSGLFCFLRRGSPSSGISSSLTAMLLAEEAETFRF
jgi:hypothetical protein